MTLFSYIRLLSCGCAVALPVTLSSSSESLTSSKPFQANINLSPGDINTIITLLRQLPCHCQVTRSMPSPVKDEKCATGQKIPFSLPSSATPLSTSQQHSCRDSLLFPSKASYSSTITDADDYVVDLVDRIRPGIIQLHSGFSQTSLENITFLGSGFIYDEKGFALTAAHLFETDSNATAQTNIFARLSDGRWFKAELVGVSHDADVAVVKLVSASVTQFTAIECDEGDNVLHQGQSVVAYGSTQYGDEPIAAFGRIVQPLQSFKELKVGLKCRYIQISLSAVPGFSGSPVFNTRGRVIAMIVKRFEDYALALPISQIAPVASSIVQFGSWSMPYIGLVLRTTTYELYDDGVIDIPTKEETQDRTPAAIISCGCSPSVAPESERSSGNRTKTAASGAAGVVVDGVKPNSPAEKAGLRLGDVITHVNHVQVTSHYQLFESTDVMSGQMVTLSILRGTKHFQVHVFPSVRNSSVSSLP